MKALLAVLACALAQSVQAQSFPVKPVRIIVPYPAGGTTDLMARALQEPMARVLGQPVIVENRAGAAGVIGTREVARTAPDGYTLLFSNNGPSSTAPLMMKEAGYDGLKDFAPVSQVSSAPLFVVIHGALPPNDLRSFIEFARAQPGKIEYASAGIGSLGHLASELFARQAGLSLVHVPYKGQAPATTAVMTGEVKLLITTSSAAMNNFIRDGKLKLLGVSTPQPSPLAPGAPAVRTVLPNYAVEVWFGLLAPAGTPGDVVARLNDAVGRALAQPDVQERFRSFGVVAQPGTPRQLAELIAEETARWAPVIREGNIRVD